MPKLRAHSRPLVKCSFEPCTVSFRKWRKRRFCSDHCRKEDWRSRHLPYYARLKQGWLNRQKQARRQARRYEWVEEGKEDQAPEWISMAETLAQASPKTLGEVQKLLGVDHDSAQI